MPTQTPSSASVLDLLMAHRSIRSFRPEPLGGELVGRLVSAGFRASTSSNMQAATAIRITDNALRKRLAELSGDQKQILEAGAFLVFCADLHRLQVACAMRGVEDADVGLAEALLVAVVDAALVMQNVAVAAESMGLGICMIGAVRNNPDAVAKELHLPQRVFAIAGMCIGHIAEDAEVKPRLPQTATLHENGYRSDEELRTEIDAYDAVQSAWYAERGMHGKDARWSTVMSRRVPGMSVRTGVSRFLQAQGLNVR